MCVGSPVYFQCLAIRRHSINIGGILCLYEFWFYDMNRSKWAVPLWRGEKGERIHEEIQESLRVRSQKEARTDWANVMRLKNSRFLRLFIWGEGLSRQVLQNVHDGHLYYHSMTLLHGWCVWEEMGFQIADRWAMVLCMVWVLFPVSLLPCLLPTAFRVQLLAMLTSHIMILENSLLPLHHTTVKAR